MTVHIDFPPIEGCKHPEWTYGVLCVKCNDCGRFNREYKCINCGFKQTINPAKEPDNWGVIEFYDGKFNICPNCKPLFKAEDETQCDPWWSAETITGYRKDFKPRKANVSSKS